MPPGTIGISAYPASSAPIGSATKTENREFTPWVVRAANRADRCRDLPRPYCGPRQLSGYRIESMSTSWPATCRSIELYWMFAPKEMFWLNASTLATPSALAVALATSLIVL